MDVQRLVDMRYLGQWRSLTVPVSAPVDLEEAVARFHAEHERAYNYRRDGSPVEIYRLSLRAVGVTPKPQLARHELNGGGAHRDRLPSRALRLVRRRGRDARCTCASDLPAGARIEGPAIIDQLDSTTVVPPGWRAEVDEWLNIRMHREVSVVTTSAEKRQYTLDPGHVRGAEERLRAPSSTRWPSRSCAPATRS